MGDRLRLRRHLYEEARRSRRHRRALRRQIQLLESMAGLDDGAGPDDGSAGVREPRRPKPSAGPAARVIEP